VKPKEVGTSQGEHKTGATARGCAAVWWWGVGGGGDKGRRRRGERKEGGAEGGSGRGCARVGHPAKKHPARGRVWQGNETEKKTHNRERGGVLVDRAKVCGGAFKTEKKGTAGKKAGNGKKKRTKKKPSDHTQTRRRRKKKARNCWRGKGEGKPHGAGEGGQGKTCGTATGEAQRKQKKGGIRQLGGGGEVCEGREKPKKNRKTRSPDQQTKGQGKRQRQKNGKEASPTRKKTQQQATRTQKKKRTPSNEQEQTQGEKRPTAGENKVATSQAPLLPNQTETNIRGEERRGSTRLQKCGGA